MRITARKIIATMTAIGLIAAGAAIDAGASGKRTSTIAHETPRTTRYVSTPTTYGAPTRYGVEIQAIYDNAGNPVLNANFSPNGALATPSWSICGPADVNTCTPTTANHEGELTAGPTPAGTVFQATATYNDHSYTARSATWQGTVRAITPPRLEGPARYNSAVTPLPATWAGGWGSEFDLVSVQACRTRDATHCVNLSPQKGYGFSDQPPIVGAWFTGWYLFAFDQRLARDTAFAEPAYLSAAAIPPVKASQIVARSAPSGAVIGPAPPKVSILTNASISDGRVLVARVRCAVRCRVSVWVADNHTANQANLSLTGSALVGVPRAQLRRGPLTVVISVGDGPILNHKTYLP